MNRLLMKIKKFLRFLEIISVILLIACTINGFVNVIARYVFAKPFAWSEEMGVLMMVWIVYLFQGVLEIQNDQLRLTVLYNVVGKKGHYVINTFRTILTIVMSCFIVVSGIGIVARNYALKVATQALNFPVWIAFLSIPVAFALVIIIRIIDPWVLFGYYTQKEEGNKL
jgi:TRAP-type C4-dicarboxylate transport system permease small subunit